MDRVVLPVLHRHQNERGAVSDDDLGVAGEHGRALMLQHDGGSSVGADVQDKMVEYRAPSLPVPKTFTTTGSSNSAPAGTERIRACSKDSQAWAATRSLGM